MRDDAGQPLPSSAPPDRPSTRRAVWRGLAAAAGALGVLLLVQFLAEGRIGAEKMLTEMAQPYGLLWIALTFAAGANLSLWLSGSCPWSRCGWLSRWPGIYGSPNWRCGGRKRRSLLNR